MYNKIAAIQFADKLVTLFVEIFAENIRFDEDDSLSVWNK